MESVFIRLFMTFGAVLRMLRYFYLAPLIKSSVGNLTRPFVVALCWFAYTFVIWHGMASWYPNDTLYRSGTGGEDLYVVIFILVAPDFEKDMIRGLYVPFRSMVLVLAHYYSYSPCSSNLKLCYRVGASVVAIIAYSYRLLVIRMMRQRKTVKFTPYILCLFMFLTAVYWFIFGILHRDLFAAIPNGFASFLGAWQLILYDKYRHKVQHAA